MTTTTEPASYEAIASDNEQLQAQVFKLRIENEKLKIKLEAYRQEVATLLANKDIAA